MTERLGKPSALRCGRMLLSAGMAGLLAGCSSVMPVVNTVRVGLWGEHSPYLTGYVGTVVADEAQAAMAGHEVLARGGNAADAAAAIGMALAVTLPSRASLGGGGACIAWRPDTAKSAQSYFFLPIAGSASGAAQRPAAVPMLARGLYLMQLRYGSVDFAETLQPAIALARNGSTVGRLLGNDLAVVQGPLLADDNMHATFTRADGSVLQAGDTLVQPHLASLLDRLRTGGVGELYNAALAHALSSESQLAGGGITAADLRSSVPVEAGSLRVRSGDVDVDFLAPPADGGLGAAASFKRGGASGVGQSVVAAWRAQHASISNTSHEVAQAQAALDSSVASGGSLPSLPASTSFTVVDRNGGVVACDLTMNNLFGTGRMAGTTGIVLAASPARFPLPLLPAGIAHTRGRVVGAVAASGQNDAADAAGRAMQSAVSGSTQYTTVGTGRVSAVICPGGMPGGSKNCTGVTDPRGDGIATQ